jgi:hypothetical protein
MGLRRSLRYKASFLSSVMFECYVTHRKHFVGPDHKVPDFDMLESDPDLTVTHMTC